MPPLLSPEQRRLAADLVVERMDAYAVILFGSAAAGSMRADSDVDLAFLTDRAPTAYDVFLAAQRIAEALNRDVDLVDFKQASTVFQAQIIGTGLLLVDRRPVERQYAFMRALKSYAMLNEERKPVLEKLGYTGGTRPDDRQHRHQ